MSDGSDGSEHSGDHADPSTLAQNLARIAQAHAQSTGRRGLHNWTVTHGLHPKVLERAAGPRGLTVATLEQVASSLALEAWQLLVPGFDPAKPPTLAIARSAMGDDLAKTLDRIPDPRRRQQAYAMALQVLEYAVGQSQDATQQP